MIQGKNDSLAAAGLAALVLGLMLRNWPHGKDVEFGSGLLLGMSIVFLIAGTVLGSRGTKA